MAKKRGKKSAKRTTKRSSKKTRSKRLVRSNKRKISLVTRNLMWFGSIFIISLILYLALGGVAKTIFSILSVIFGFVSVAFILVLLILVFLRLLKK